MTHKNGNDLSSAIARGWAELRASQAMEWEEKGMCDDVYYVVVHVPCGTNVRMLMSHQAICPKCQPEEWARKLGAN